MAVNQNEVRAHCLMDFLTTHAPFYKVAEDCLSANEHMEKRTADQRRRLLKGAVFPKIGRRQICDIHNKDILFLLEQIPFIDKKYSVFCLLNRIFRYAQQRGLILYNPCDGINVRYYHKIPCRELTDAQLVSLAKVIPQIACPEIYMFALLSGLPFNECAALHWKDIELETGKCSVTHQWRTQEDSKYRSELIPAARKRKIILPDPCTEFLRSLSARMQTELLFPSEKNALLTKNDIQNCLLLIHQESELIEFHNNWMKGNFIARCLREEIDVACLEAYYGYREGYFLTSEKMFHLIDVGFAGRYDFQKGR